VSADGDSTEYFSDVHSEHDYDTANADSLKETFYDLTRKQVFEESSTQDNSIIQSNQFN